MSVNAANRGWGDFFEEPPPVPAGRRKSRGKAQRGGLPADFDHLVVTLNAAGHLDKEIAARVGCSITSVTNCRKRLGVARVSPDITWTAVELEGVRRYVDALLAYRRACRALRAAASDAVAALSGSRSRVNVIRKASHAADLIDTTFQEIL